jgi:hydroxypyruvate reductase
VIASGPTVPSDFTRAGARAVVDRYGVTDRLPVAVRAALGTPELPRDFSILGGDLVEVVGDNAIALQAFAMAAETDGVHASIVWHAKQGEARDLAVGWVDQVERAGDAILLLGGGEATVTVRGDGIGGRNTEFALAAALELERRDIGDWTIASLATDGQDALTGVAGAIASAETIASARALGLDPIRALETNDSLAVFDAAGGAVQTGPTGTNVNDIYVALRHG